jgi:Putative Ig domain
MIRSSCLTVRLFAAALIILGLSLSSSLIGCGGHAAAPSEVTITGPASDTIDPGDTASFTGSVTGGPSDAGVTWTLTGCSVSSCGTLSSVTLFAATYNAPATVATGFTVTLTATSTAKGSITNTITLTVPANPSITTAAGALASGTIGTAYSVTLAGAGGIPPYTWSIAQGALPAGLTLSPTTGAITGTPAAAGTASFTVTLTDSGSPALTATAAYTLTTAYPSLSITTTSLPNATEGTSYTATLAATGGSGTGYTWSVTSGTALSAVNLTLSPAGAITGIPNAGETSTPVTVQVTDSANNTATATLSLTSVAFQGQVLSGTKPVSGATIQLYAAGSAGNATAATPMLTQTLITDGLGGFTLSGLYTCGQSSTGSTITGSNQVYLVATGGTTSTTSTTSNPALILVTAIGPCSNLASTPPLTINELTTAAAAWALASFSSSATTIGATSTNTLGITNAFLDAALLANPSTGAPTTLPAGLTVEAGKLAALADALNSCTSAGACTPLFTAATPTNTAPTDTFTAALNIVHNPGQNVAAVYATIPATPPFSITPLTASPNDWTMSLTVTGGGLVIPTALGIDSQNNVWVADEAGPLSAFNPQGTPLSSTGFGIANGTPFITDVFGLAIDPSNNIWVTNEQGYGGGGSGSITEFYGVNNPANLGTSPQSGGYNVNFTIQYPVSIAADTNGEIYVANTGTSSVSTYNGSGGLISADLGQGAGLAAGQNAVAIDAAHGFWLSTNNGDIAHFSQNGTLLVDAVCCGESAGIATDSAGDLWIADYLGGSNFQGAVAEAVTDSSGNTSVPISDLVTGGISYPVAVAVDAAQNVWFANRINDSITELAGVNSTLPIATAISPSTGVYGTGGYGLDAALGGPYSLLPDRSGNLWVSNEGAYTVTMFFGLAAPTITPLQPIPTAP